jgi:hypothetical protein
VALAIGSMLGDALLHLIPHALAATGELTHTPRKKSRQICHGKNRDKFFTEKNRDKFDAEKIATNFSRKKSRQIRRGKNRDKFDVEKNCGENLPHFKISTFVTFCHNYQVFTALYVMIYPHFPHLICRDFLRPFQNRQFSATQYSDNFPQ